MAGATLGRDGVLAWDGSEFHYCPAFRVDTVDTTGAGDLFHAGFAYALLRGDTLPAILEFSCAAAALNCTAIGARGGIRSVEEIEELREAALAMIASSMKKTCAATPLARATARHILK